MLVLWILLYDLSIPVKKVFKNPTTKKKWQPSVPYGSMLHLTPTIYHLLAAKQEPCQNGHLFKKNTEEFSGK